MSNASVVALVQLSQEVVDTHGGIGGHTRMECPTHSQGVSSTLTGGAQHTQVSNASVAALVQLFLTDGKTPIPNHHYLNPKH